MAIESESGYGRKWLGFITFMYIFQCTHWWNCLFSRKKKRNFSFFFSPKIVQWLYQNLTDHFSRITKHHWRPLFLNTQSLTPKETRYSIQQKLHYVNDTAITYSTILTLNQIMYADEGLYMCKSLSPRPMQMTYQVQVIRMRLRVVFFLNLIRL